MLAVLILVALAYWMITSFYTDIQKRLILQIVNNSMSHVDDYIKLSGGIEKKGDQLILGDVALNNSTAFVDHIYSKTGFGCTVFLENVRISTTAKIEDSERRAVGTKANAEVTKKVLKKEEDFIGTTRTLDREWLIYYKPIRDINGEKVGMIALFKEESDFQADNFMFKVLIAVALIMLGISAIYFIFQGNQSYQQL